MLRLTSRGIKVEALQQQLNILGYSLTIDGIFGQATLAAVRDFQLKGGITVDGKVGHNTQNAIMNALGFALPKRPHTAHFNYGEFISSKDSHAVKNGIPQAYWANIQQVMDRLEVVRKAVDNFPIVIRSGYRSPAYNRKIGGAGNSQHLYGKAADIYIENHIISCCDLANRIYSNDALRGLFGGYGFGSDTNLHVDIRAKDNPLKPTVWWYGKKGWKEWCR